MSTLNGVRVTSVALNMPWVGVWYADVSLELEDGQVRPTGPAVLTIGVTTCKCFVDDRFSGSFGQNVAVRVLGGSGGWHRPVAAQHYHNAGGVLLSSVVSTTAPLVGEVVTVTSDTIIGTDFVRANERASRVLDDQSWWVGLDGVTVVGPRVNTPAPVSAGLTVIDYDPNGQVITLASDEILEPGTVVTNSYFGSLTLRDVAVSVSASGGFRIVASVGPLAVSRLRNALQRLAAEASGSTWCRKYRYRVVIDSGDTLALQSSTKAVGMPDMVPLSIWHGAPGVSAVLTPGAEVLIEFLEGDPAQPVVTAFEPSEGAGFLPLLLKLNASVAVQVGNDSALPVAHAAETLAAINALLTALSAVGGALTALGAAPLTGTTAGGIFSTAIGTASSAISGAATTLPTLKLLAE